MLLPPLLGELPFHGSLQHGRLVPLEVRLNPLQRGHGLIEAGKLLFDFGDDFVLYIYRRERYVKG